MSETIEIRSSDQRVHPSLMQRWECIHRRLKVCRDALGQIAIHKVDARGDMEGATPAATATERLEDITELVDDLVNGLLNDLYQLQWRLDPGRSGHGPDYNPS